jgi:hypothetical protein
MRALVYDCVRAAVSYSVMLAIIAVVQHTHTTEVAASTDCGS